MQPKTNIEPLVIYIIGDNRSGSTLLDYLLSCHPEAVSVGELHHLHSYFCRIGVGKRLDWKCNCGKQIQDCTFWQKVIEEVSFDENSHTSIMTKFKESKLGYLNRRFLRSDINKLINHVDGNGELIANNIWRIYNAIHKISGKKIIIDSSKNPLEAFFINKYRKGNIKFLLLNRDIWEVAYSKWNRMRGFSTEFKEYMNLKEESIYKNILSSNKIRNRNRYFIEKLIECGGAELCKSVDYLKLTRAPIEEIGEICSFVGIDTYTPPAKVSNNLKMHTLHGSPSRGKEQAIKPDERWKAFYKEKPFALLFGKVLQHNYNS